MPDNDNDDNMNIVHQHDLLNSPMGALEDSASLGAMIDDDWNNAGAASLFADDTLMGTNESENDNESVEQPVVMVWSDDSAEEVREGDSTEPIKYRPSTPPSPVQHEDKNDNNSSFNNNNKNSNNPKDQKREASQAASSIENQSTSSSQKPFCYSPERGGLPWKENDVPLGRAQEVREFIGNCRYRDMVERNRPAYLKAVRRAEKTNITASIYNKIKSLGGRFLDKKLTKKKTDDGKKVVSEEIWYEISQEKALAKISQALRMGTGSLGNSKSSPYPAAAAAAAAATGHPPAMHQHPSPYGYPASASMDTTPLHNRGAYPQQQQPMTPQQKQLTGMTISVPQQHQQYPHHHQAPFHPYPPPPPPGAYPASPLPNAIPTSPNVVYRSATAATASSPTFSPPNMTNLKISNRTSDSSTTLLRPMEAEATEVVGDASSLPMESMAGGGPPMLPQYRAPPTASSPTNSPIRPTQLARGSLSYDEGDRNRPAMAKPNPIGRHRSDGINAMAARRDARRKRRPNSFTTIRRTTSLSSSPQPRRSSSAVRPRDDSADDFLGEDSSWQHQHKKRLPTPPRKNSHESAPGSYLQPSDLTLSSTAEEGEEEAGDCQSDEQDLWRARRRIKEDIGRLREESAEEEADKEEIDVLHDHDNSNQVQGSESPDTITIAGQEVELDFEPIPVALDRNKPPFVGGGSK